MNNPFDTIFKCVRLLIYTTAITLIATAVLRTTQREMFISAMVKTSYVSSINLPEEQAALVVDSLKRFNNIGVSRNNLKEEITEDLIPSDGYRPIIYRAMPDTLKEKAAGLAVVLPFACIVYINQDFFVSKEMAEHIIIHETMHCLGYDHVASPFDVMHARVSRHTDNYSYAWYYLDLYKKKREWGAI